MLGALLTALHIMHKHLNTYGPELILLTALSGSHGGPLCAYVLGGRGHISQTPGKNSSVTIVAFTPPTVLPLKGLLGSSGLKALPQCPGFYFLSQWA